ncbi:MAG: TIGR04282 family arsenosugar biosynthesis glycosyltransferase [Balneolaceae bacterium]|nr:TIGR04282 family arsenosugar biosynthesis glycosyltransferase [Balneolaceae bacterium]
MKDKKLLLVFVKNPEKGKVKTRLAKTVGDDKAYQTYLKLLDYTIDVARKVNAKKQVWYSSFIDESDRFLGKRSDGSRVSFEKKLQKGDNLGRRMLNAFQQGFEDGFKKIVIIGSDCPGITPQIIEGAFTGLDQKEVVIGPSKDGGYYLLGMSELVPGIFNDISWSTEQVLSETKTVLKKADKDYRLLSTLNDIDTEEDLRKSDFE